MFLDEQSQPRGDTHPGNGDAAPQGPGRIHRPCSADAMGVEPAGVAERALGVLPLSMTLPIDLLAQGAVVLMLEPTAGRWQACEGAPQQRLRYGRLVRTSVDGSVVDQPARASRAG